MSEDYELEFEQIEATSTDFLIRCTLTFREIIGDDVGDGDFVDLSIRIPKGDFLEQIAYAEGHYQYEEELKRKAIKARKEVDNGTA